MFGMAIKNVNGTIVETGDFKIDLTPIGPVANIGKIARKNYLVRGLALHMIQESSQTQITQPCL